MNHAIFVQKHLGHVAPDTLVSDDAAHFCAMSRHPFLRKLVPLTLGDCYEGFCVEGHEISDVGLRSFEYFIGRFIPSASTVSHAHLHVAGVTNR